MSVFQTDICKKKRKRVLFGKAFAVPGGGEPAAFNTRAFTLRISEDGENWTDAVQVTDNAAGLSRHAIPLTSARYVQLVVEKPTQGGDTAARIYGLEVMGLK
ncbi:discoidin domain-containing protein [Saccharibacillus kuerlensis]|uniref:F5/8 type C domain-containing protein n=1 Tax=Saccharibacillus kuerlensis TaxID=459527 RepID=A0ABQ2L2W3_9BACL|nr:hypothetical protein GCM10010969_21980 [Saccharibacillus kuerlensis]